MCQEKWKDFLIIWLGRRGAWTDDEVDILTKAVYHVTNTAEDQPVPFHGIHWPSVAKIVKTRAIFQCRQKWWVYTNFYLFFGW